MPDEEKKLVTKPYEVIRSQIRDSLGIYREPGEYAELTREHAKDYLEKNFIRLELPEEEADLPSNEGGASAPSKPVTPTKA